MNQVTPLFQDAYTSTALPVSVFCQRAPLLAVVTDNPRMARELTRICQFFDIAIERVSSEQDLTAVLCDCNPMGVVAELDATEQDGFHVMKIVATHDPTLPMLLLTGHDPHLAGAADAVEQVWGLTSVRQSPFLSPIGHLVEFFCHAGRQGNCLSLMPA